ncbi:LCP family protein [Nakamurella deserti]|uniref:LCP family protein n=1 Tax=Nakamurella deserti TaxID=2164074 RepID=UPI0014783A0D|nr:LCP family protein [Nakamurella deserti]
MTGRHAGNHGADGDRRAAHLAGAATTAPRHRHPWFNYTWHIVIAVFSVFVLAVTGIYWNIVRVGNAGLDSGSVDAGIGGGNSLVTRQPTAGGGTGTTSTAATVYAPENFLLVGSDTRAGDNNIDGGEAELEGVANTDSMMLLHISGDRQHIYAVSLPRDMWAPNVPCERYDQNTDTYSGVADGADLSRQHMNSFYGVGGPKCLVDAVENLTQLPVDHYIQIDFAGFQSMVDALGGVAINACGPIVDETLQTILPTGGQQVINGAQALNLARARKVVGDPSSDLSRIHRQQLILSAILREVKSAGTLLDPGKLTAFVNAFTQNTTTGNVTFQSLMDLAESIGNLDPALVNFFTMPTTPDPNDTGRGSMFIDEAAAAPLLDALRNDTPVPGTETTPVETPAPTTAAEITTLTLAPDAVDLQIVNAAGVAGIATRASEALDALGFATTEDDLDSDETTQTGVTVRYSAGNEAAALTVAAAVPGAVLETAEGLGSRVALRLGSDWDESVAAVAVGDPIAADLLAQVPAGSAGNVVAPTTSEPTGTTTTTTVVNAADASCL